MESQPVFQSFIQLIILGSLEIKNIQENTKRVVVMTVDKDFEKYAYPLVGFFVMQKMDEDFENSQLRKLRKRS